MLSISVTIVLVTLISPAHADEQNAAVQTDAALIENPPLPRPKPPLLGDTGDNPAEMISAFRAAQRGTHIHARNRKRFDGAVAVVRCVAVTICALDFSWRSLCSFYSTMPEPRRRFGDSHHVSEKLCG